MASQEALEVVGGPKNAVKRGATCVHREWDGVGMEANGVGGRNNTGKPEATCLRREWDGIGMRANGVDRWQSMALESAVRAHPRMQGC